MAVLFQTERLTVRNFRPEDAADLAEILTDPDVTYFEPYEAFTAEACVQEAVKLSESRELFAVVLGEKVIGKLYFSARGFGSYEVGWTLHGAYQGKGYAAESVRSLMEYAFREKGVRRVIAEIDTRNDRSVRLAERLGMRREAEHMALFPRKENNTLFNNYYVYAILAEEFAG